MSKYSEVCKLCSNAPLSDTLLRAEACVYRGNPAPYAALETHLSPVSLPSVLSTSFMGGAASVSPCTIGDSVVSTILAVCSSVKKLDYMIHVVKEGELELRELAEITSRCMGGKECIVLSALAPSGGSGTSFRILSSSSRDGAIVDEDSAMRILLSTVSAFEGAVWYWSVDLLGYSYILNAEEKSMWIANVKLQRSPSDARSPRVAVPSSGKQNVRILPFFYSNPSTPVAAMMGTGGAIGFCKTDLAVEVAALSRTAVDRAYCSTAPTGRCFCCQYIDTIHSTFHSRIKQSSDVTHELKLSKQFRQKVKKRA